VRSDVALGISLFTPVFKPCRGCSITAMLLVLNYLLPVEENNAQAAANSRG
jgi:hypothetical protein